MPLRRGVQFLGGVSVAYSGEYLTDSSSYAKIDTRIGIAPTDNRWDLLLIGNNLSDELILNNSMVFVANAGYLKLPRRVSLQCTWRFGR